MRNICLLDSRPTLFDAIEFNDSIANIDVLFDMAFLVMDFVHRGRVPLANQLLNHYLALTGDYGGLAAMPLFLSCRAAIKAHTTAASAASQPREAGAETAVLREEARRYLDLAL